jgi:transposase
VVSLSLYAYARGNRFSRGLERTGREDVVYILITSMMVTDHSTIAEYRRRHERALGELFSAVLGLGRAAELVEVGVIAIDGTKIRATISSSAAIVEIAAGVERSRWLALPPSVPGQSGTCAPGVCATPQALAV